MARVCLDEALSGAPKALVDLAARCPEKSPDARPRARDLCDAPTAIADAERAPDALELAREHEPGRVAPAPT